MVDLTSPDDSQGLVLAGVPLALYLIQSMAGISNNVFAAIVMCWIRLVLIVNWLASVCISNGHMKLG